MENIITTTAGVDLGDLTSQVCVINASGSVIQTQSIKTTRSGFERFFSDRRCRVVLECGTHSPWVSELLEELGNEVIVANPRNVALIAKSRKKSDRKDAELLSRLGRFDPSLLSPIQHRGRQARADLGLIRARHALVRARSLLVNHIRGVVKSYGARLPSCSTNSFAEKVLELVPAELRAALEPLLEQVSMLSQRIKAMAKEISEALPERYPEIHRLSQVSGVGPITSATFVLTLEDPNRFARNRHAAAFLGLTPARKQTGQSDPEMHISKAGDRFLRCLLVECAQFILSSRGADSDLKRFGLSLAGRGRKAAKKRAVVATARKLSVLLCSLWRSGETYQPLRHGEARAA
jgi:transposase